ncbi:MAG TPA: response regulator, partial [Acetomicrobium sp.]|nr:response regulator [Acetomicrobium sp.]
MPKVLIVDDAAFMRMMLKDILIKNGYEIAGEVSNGVEAVSMYKEAKPDIVTMDITMPEMDGITALKEILTINFAQERFLLELMFG